TRAPDEHLRCRSVGGCSQAATSSSAGRDAEEDARPAEPSADNMFMCTREWTLGEEKSPRRWDEGLNNSCFVRILFFCRGRTDKVREVEITTQCPECRGDHLVRDYSRAEIVCEDCGLVLDDMIIDEGPDGMAFDSEQRESR